VLGLPPAAFLTASFETVGGVGNVGGGVGENGFGFAGINGELSTTTRFSFVLSECCTPPLTV